MTGRVIRMWTEKDIVDLLYTNTLAIERAVIALYNMQTSDEQDKIFTHYHNGVGFNSMDVDYLSFMAKWFLDGGHIKNPAKIERLRNCVLKYRKQLVGIANHNAATKAANQERVA